MSAKNLKEKRLVRQWLRKNKPTKCKDCYGEPIHSMTAVPKYHV